LKLQSKKWHCPYCPQDSTRHWNIVTHIKRKHDGRGEPIENGNLRQSVNPGFPISKVKPAEDMTPPTSYDTYNRPYTNHASKSSKGDEDMIDKWYQIVTEQQEKEHKIKTIKEFYSRYPDAPMPISNIDSSILPIKKMLEQSLTRISCQNEPKNNPSSQIHGQKALRTYLTYTRPKIASQNTGSNSPLIAFPSYNRDTHPQSIQSMSWNHDDKYNNRSGTVKIHEVDYRGFKVTMTVKYNCLGDVIDMWVTDGLYEYLSQRERHRQKRLQEYSSSRLFLPG
jgi:hypothetical protein